MPARISRAAYADMYGPTKGDKIRLADTELVIEVEDDRTIYGEEVKFGGGKVIRDGMGQAQVTRAAGAVDTVITNALILDHWGIVKADVGINLVYDEPYFHCFQEALFPSLYIPLLELCVSFRNNIFFK